MGDTTSEGASLTAGIDLTSFYPVFFDEAGENLDRMEAQLLEIDVEAADDEALNSIFRCAHSVKGGAATFGFADVAELTHQMETLLDRLRRRELVPTAAMIDVLLRSGDALRAQLARHQGTGGAAVDTAELLSAIHSMSAGAAPPAAVGDAARAASPSAASVPAAPGAPAAVSSADSSAAPAAEPTAAAGCRRLELRVGPLADASVADHLVALFDEITDLGTIEPIDGGHPSSDGVRRFEVRTSSSDADLFDLFTFHVAREQVALRPLAEGGGDDRAAPVEAPKPAPRGVARADKAPAATLESSSLRVSVEKVDQLVNLVGELVITQAMLAQHAEQVDPARCRALAAGLADLERNTRALQESVMSIRMIPMSVVYSRFPRMLRDLAAQLGKKVEFVTRGESTELDKGLVEKITDPLTHLVRNSCDHGIERPAERLAAAKPEHGTITLAASHRGGSVLIEVRDDGRGLSRAKLLTKARERGIDASDAMTDAEVWNLIFAPGFSTADVVTDVSGRGVGMDVVKKNIAALGGSVEIESAEHCGMCVTVRLPLTLAIMDGLSIGVGAEVYVLPLASVVESFQVAAGGVRTVGGSGRVVELRGEYVPVLDLGRLFEVPRVDVAPAGGILVVVEAEGGRAALRVDRLIGQQQVVVKNLEANYRRVDDVSGATIMGDGRVALILDVASLVRRARL